MERSIIIAKPGSENAVSFTDDTSPNTLATKKRNVSINGQVKRENPLDWYYQLLYLCRDKSEGEIKTESLRAFVGMPLSSRQKIWHTLKEVQINIADPLPYEAATNDLVKKITNHKDSIEQIRDRAIANDKIAQMQLEFFNNQTAERVLMDAPSVRLSFDLYYAQNPMALYASDDSRLFPARPDHRVDLSHLRSKKSGSIVRAATEFAAKSASAFSAAIDACRGRPHFMHEPMLNPVLRELRKAHAFDEGNEKSIELMEVERERLAKRMVNFEYDVFFEESPCGYLEPLEGTLNSKELYFIQASDIAGRIASHLFENGGVFTITLHFEYVMLNGKRISQNEAFETTRKWEEMGYFN